MVFTATVKSVVPIILLSIFSTTAYSDPKPAIPRSGAYVGAALGGAMPITQFNDAVGFMHSMNVEFYRFPKVVTDQYRLRNLRTFIEQSITANAIPVITIETYEGLSSYTVGNIEVLAQNLASFPTGILLRFNHEMNGNWYPWGQQPTLYKSKFREFAGVMKRIAPNVAMLWAPNQGEGYPWNGGSLAGGTDPYAGFYPGDDVVDWVGMSAYHYGYDSALGTTGNNVIPKQGAWIERLRGNGREVPDFYTIYAAQKAKPMIITESSAMFNNSRPGPAEVEIKSEWIEQAYVRDAFPWLKAICWFNVEKYKPEFNETISWRIDTDARLVNAYASAVSGATWIKGNDYVLFDNTPPSTVTRGTTYTFPLTYIASGSRDVQINLLKRGSGAWKLVTRSTTRVTAGRGTARMTLNVPTTAVTGSDYVFEIRILPVGAPWYSRLQYDQSSVAVR